MSYTPVGLVVPVTVFVLSVYLLIFSVYNVQFLVIFVILMLPLCLTVLEFCLTFVLNGPVGFFLPLRLAVLWVLSYLCV